MKVYWRGRNISFKVKKVSFFGKISGLMFRTPSTDNLLFTFSRRTRISLHSWFVFFPFLVLWLDEENNVLEWSTVYPFSTVIRPQKSFSAVVEIPFHARNRRFFQFFV